jgi:crotonobetainyl-CoA:carnitine CoA-transferase CaiB-like acyl-CoA transferase
MLTLISTDRVAVLNSIIYKVTMTGYVMGFFALMVALVALYQRQAVQAGTFGVVALCAAIAGTMTWRATCGSTRLSPPGSRM